MDFDKDQIIKLSRLARLKLDDSEATRYAKELSQIIHHVDKISALDEKIASFTEQTTLVPYEREDEAVASLATEKALEQAPDASGSSFKVPRIIES